MTNDELPLGGDEPREGKAKYRVELLPYEQTRVSPKNPRYGYEITESSVAALVAELKAVGQMHDAVGEPGSDGMVEILAGSRRREACRILGRPLRVRIYDKLSPEAALKIANREDRGALEVSLWDRSASWTRMLDGKVVASEARLAEAVGEDKSATLAFDCECIADNDSSMGFGWFNPPGGKDFNDRFNVPKGYWTRSITKRRPKAERRHRAVIACLSGRCGRRTAVRDRSCVISVHR